MLRPRKATFARESTEQRATLKTIQRGRRVRRATSRVEIKSSQAGKGSLTYGEKLTDRETAADVGVAREETEFINDLHVWFRSFRVKLSRMRIWCQYRKAKSSAVSRIIQ